MSLKDKVALVTGAARGIGRAIAIELARNGIKVAGVDVNEDHANKITLFFNELGLESKGFVMNLAETNSVEAGYEEIVKVYGAPDILVNNAGVTRDNLMLRMSPEEWDTVININLTGVFRITRLCLRSMVKKRWGRIVSISSVVGFTGNAGQANYSASKAGVVAFSKSLAQEVGSRNVTVNAIAPGFIETDMTGQLNQEQRDRILNTIPLKRSAQPEEVAKIVKFLVSDDAAYITGSTIHLNGGMY